MATITLGIIRFSDQREAVCSAYGFDPAPIFVDHQAHRATGVVPDLSRRLGSKGADMGTLSDRRNFGLIRQHILIVGTALLALFAPYPATGAPLHFVNVTEKDNLFGDDPINIVSSTSGPGPVAILNDSPRTQLPVLKGFPGLNYINGSLFAVAASGGLLKAAPMVESAEGTQSGIDGATGRAQFGVEAKYQYDDLVLTATAPGVPDLFPIVLNLDVNALLSTNGVQSEADTHLGLVISLVQLGFTQVDGGVNVHTATFLTGANSFVQRSGFFVDPGQPARADGHFSNLGVRVCGRGVEVVDPASAPPCERMTIDIPFPGFRMAVGPFQLSVTLFTSASVFASDFPHFLGSAKIDVSHTVSFPTSGPVFTLPDGVTVSSAQANITNNRFVMITTGPSGTPNPVASGGVVNVSVTPVDSLGRALGYGWTALCGGLGSNGTFDNAALQTPIWTAPANLTGGPQDCMIQVTVSDGHGLSQKGSYTQTVSSVPHTLTITTGPNGTPNPVASGGAVNLSVTAVDSLGQALSYAWTALCGGLASNGSFDNAALQGPTWTAPANPAGGAKSCAIQVTVSDGQKPNQSAMYTQIVNSSAAAAGGGCSSPGGDPGLLPLVLLAAAGLCRRSGLFGNARSRCGVPGHRYSKRGLFSQVVQAR